MQEEKVCRCRCRGMTEPSAGAFDLRVLGLDKLRVLSEGAGYVYYRDARRYLCQLFHLRKVDGRQLLLEMSRVGLVSFDARGKVWLKGQMSSPLSLGRRRGQIASRKS